MDKENASPRSLSKIFMTLTICGIVCYAFIAPELTNSWQSLKDLPQEIAGWRSFMWKNENVRAINDTEAELTNRLEKSNDTKVILIWHKPGWMKGTPRVTHPKCGKCEVTEDKTQINNTATGAVVFFFSGISGKSMPPASTRNLDQLHVFWTIEPPPNMSDKKSVVESTYQFNATMSYRRTSDFYANYDSDHADQVIRQNLSESAILNMKKKGGLALVSNCHRHPGARMRFKILQRIKSLGFPMDTFGKCFPSNHSLEKGRDAMKSTRQYKFYFSFENSYHCQDYITEKAFRTPLYWALAVPVVWGATKQEYETFLRKGSYIFAEDFDSPEKLVEYLQYLMRNDTAYLEYFRWHKSEPRKIEEPIFGYVAGFCQLCRALHGVNIDDQHDPRYDPSNPKRPIFSEGTAKRKSISIRSYLFDEENEECNENDETKLDFYKKWKLDK